MLRGVLFRASFVVGAGSICTACAAAIPQTGSAKLGEALAFAAAAGALQLAQAAQEQHARNTAPIRRSGLAASAQCDNDDQYLCASVNVQPAVASPEPEMSVEDAREYVLGYVNGVRKLNGVESLVRDQSLDSFAQAGSEELALDHLPKKHWMDHGPEVGARCGEVQGPSDGSGPGLLEDQIAAVLLDAMREGAGGERHDTLLRPEWQRLGVGIAQNSGRTYFTADFSR